MCAHLMADFAALEASYADLLADMVSWSEKMKELGGNADALTTRCVQTLIAALCLPYDFSRSLLYSSSEESLAFAQKQAACLRVRTKVHVLLKYSMATVLPRRGHSCRAPLQKPRIACLMQASGQMALLRSRPGAKVCRRAELDGCVPQGVTLTCQRPLARLNGLALIFAGACRPDARLLAEPNACKNEGQAALAAPLACSRRGLSSHWLPTRMPAFFNTGARTARKGAALGSLGCDVCLPPLNCDGEGMQTWTWLAGRLRRQERMR